MSILFMELKKIWRLPTVILIAIFMLQNYNLTVDYYGSLSEVNRTHWEEREVMMELSQRFGKTLEEEEFPEAQKMLEELHEELDEIIRNHEDYDTNKVKDYATFKEIEGESWEMPSPENDQALGHYMYDNHHDLILKEDMFAGVLSEYEIKMNDPTYRTYTDSQGELASAQWEEGKGRSLMPYYVEYMTQNTIYGQFMYATFYMMLLLLPTVVRDRKNNLQDLQWSSFTGRKVLWIQYLAHWVTAMVFLLPAPLFLLHYINVEEIMYFWDYSMLFFYASTTYLLDFTLKQLVWCYLLFSFVASFAMSGFIFLLSRYSKNYPSLLLKAVPIMLFIWFSTESWQKLFSLNHRRVGVLFLPWLPWLEVYLLIACLVIVGIVTILMFKREKTRDLL